MINQKKRDIFKIKKIIIFVGNEMEIFELSMDEKFICSKKEVKAKSYNMSKKIQEYKKHISESQNNQRLNHHIFKEKKDTQSDISSKKNNKSLYLFSNEGELFTNFEPKELEFDDLQNGYNNIF